MAFYIPCIRWLICLMGVVSFIPTSYGIRPWPAASTEVNAITEGSTLEGFEKQGRILRLQTSASRHVFRSDLPFDSGLIRWKLDSGPGLDIALDFIGETNASGVVQRTRLKVTTEGLSLVHRQGDKDSVQVDEPMRLHKRKRLEIIGLVQENTLLIEVFDPRKNAILRALHLPRMHSVRHLGIEAGAAHDASLLVRALTVRPLCPARWPRSSVGRARYVTLTAEQADMAGRIVGRKRLVRKEKQGKDQAVYRTDLESIERLRCARISIGRVSIETPWKYMDPSYLRYKDTQPAATRKGFRIDRSYKNSAMNEALLKAYAKRFPTLARYVEIGKSHQGKVIPGLVITAPTEEQRPKPSVFINGAHHGNEPMSVEFVYDMIQLLLERSQTPRVQRWLRTNKIWVFPIINPDGVDAYLEETWRTGRKNGRDLNQNGVRERLEGVDLNRNYPFRWGALGERGSKSNIQSPWYRGEEAASEPEVQAVMKLARQERFAAAITFHTGTVKLLVPYTIPGVDNPTPHVAWKVAERLIDGLDDHPQDKEWVVAKNLYPVDGTDQDWHYHTNGTLAYLVEGARRNPRTAEERSAILENVRPLTTRLLDRIHRGPTLHGRIVDAKGRPVHAEIRVKGVRLRNNEKWLTRCKDGHFTRFLAHGGATSISVHVPGQPTVTKRVRPKRGLTWVEVKLDFEVAPSECHARF